jgi:hypothetical protein
MEMPLYMVVIVCYADSSFDKLRPTSAWDPKFFLAGTTVGKLLKKSIKNQI